MTKWRAYLIGGLLFVMAVLSGYIVHLQTAKKLAEDAATNAKSQTVISEGTAQAVDRLLIEERNITHEVQNVVRQIDALPSGEALVPDPVTAAWANAIDGLRNATPDAKGDGAGKPEDLP